MESVANLKKKKRKKRLKPEKKIPKNLFYATFQYGRYSVFKNFLKIIFFDPEKVKKLSSKVAHNRLRPFYSTVQPRTQPTAQNWFSILWNLRTRHLLFYLCHVLLGSEIYQFAMKYPALYKKQGARHDVKKRLKKYLFKSL